MMTVAALYIDPRGPYPSMPGVDCWDKERDALRYIGMDPVVAHPPCGPWGSLKHLYRGNDHECAVQAASQVRNFGGVLEHPARSKLWHHERLPFPGELPDAWGGYTVEVTQVEWGHPCRKRTWLYLVGVPRAALESPPFPGRKPTHWLGGSRGTSKKRRGSPIPPGIKALDSKQNHITPPLFAEYLVHLARSVIR